MSGYVTCTYSQVGKGLGLPMGAGCGQILGFCLGRRFVFLHKDVTQVSSNFVLLHETLTHIPP